MMNDYYMGARSAIPIMATMQPSNLVQPMSMVGFLLGLVTYQHQGSLAELGI